VHTALVAVMTVLVLGLNWPIMSVGVRSVPPLWFGVIRLGGSGLLLAVLLAYLGRLHLPARADLPIVLSVALPRLAVSQGLVVTALTFVASGRASVLVYTSALWAAPLSVWLLKERLGRRSVGAVLVGTLGVIVLTEPWSTTGSRPVLGAGLLLIAALMNALGAIHIRRHRWAGDQIELMVWQLLLAGAALVPAALIVHGLPRIMLTPAIVANLAYQVLAASLLGLWGTVTLARRLTAVTTAMVSLATPVVGVISSAILLGERIDAIVLIGMALVLGGVTVRIRDAGIRPSGVADRSRRVQGD
jgi:drug/metabolite transporter (DMT)-like permease